MIILQLFFLIGWIVAIVLGLTVVYGTWASSKKGGKPFNEAENVIYASLSRFTWAVAVAWVIFACHNGFGGNVFCALFNIHHLGFHQLEHYAFRAILLISPF